MLEYFLPHYKFLVKTTSLKFDGKKLGNFHLSEKVLTDNNLNNFVKTNSCFSLGQLYVV